MCRLWSSFDWNQSSLQKKLTRPAGDDLVNGLLLKTIGSKRGVCVCGSGRTDCDSLG